MSSPDRKSSTRLSVGDVVAANIDRAMLKAGLSNRELADQIGTTEHAVWRWRRGKVAPSEPYVAAIARELFGGSFAAMYSEAGRAA